MEALLKMRLARSILSPLFVFDFSSDEMEVEAVTCTKRKTRWSAWFFIVQGRTQIHLVFKKRFADNGYFGSPGELLIRFRFKHASKSDTSSTVFAPSFTFGSSPWRISESKKLTEIPRYMAACFLSSAAGLRPFVLVTRNLSYLQIPM